MNQLINLSVFKNFFKSTNSGGILLCICVVVSLIIANSPLGKNLQSILDTRIGYSSGGISLDYNILFWINDGLMSIFFLLVGLEIKREIIEGELSSPRKASLPILCAIGGAMVPALIYLFFNTGKDTSGGWGIPMATDIAFSLAIIGLLGSRIPSGLKIFLAALAIADDLIAIVVIAFFYSSGIDISYLLYAGIGMIILVIMNRVNIQNPYLYLIPGIFIWYFIHHSGIHATIAGVLVAMTIPTNDSDKESPLERLEQVLIKPVNFFVIPLFALANTNIAIESNMVHGLMAPLGMGIGFGLLFGKPLGIFTMSLVCSKLKISQLPDGCSFKHIAGVGLVAGIGFTMSIFISILSFNDILHINEAKLSILLTSSIAGIVGFFVLRIISKPKKVEI